MQGKFIYLPQMLLLGIIMDLAILVASIMGLVADGL
jgi:hypothetical protein